MSTPLPDDGDEDFPSPHLLLGRMARPASKVAGVRHSESKSRGKRKAVDPPVSSGLGVRKRKVSAPAHQSADVKKPRGRATGAVNYAPEDLEGLFDILEEQLPLGGRAWNSAADDYNQWAEENGRPVRTAKSLELKFKQVSVIFIFYVVHFNTFTSAGQNLEANRRCRMPPSCSTCS